MIAIANSDHAGHNALIINNDKFYSTGKQFRESIKIEDFDLLILDWHLPDTTGIDELDWLRKEKASNTDNPDNG